MFKLKSWSLLVALVGVFALVAYTVWDWAGALLVLGVGFAVNWFSRDRAAGLILRLHRARPLSEWEAPQLHRVAGELAARAQIALPHLMVYPGEIPNAFALGTRADQGVVAVSSALLQLLDRREMTGVLAHEFAHLKNRDSLLSLSAGIFVQAITLLSQVFGLMLLFYFLFGAGPLLQAGLWPLLVLVGGWRPRGAALLSGDPQGLAYGVAQIAGVRALYGAVVSAVSVYLYFGR